MDCKCLLLPSILLVQDSLAIVVYWSKDTIRIDVCTWICTSVFNILGGAYSVYSGRSRVHTSIFQEVLPVQPFCKLLDPLLQL